MAAAPTGKTKSTRLSGAKLCGGKKRGTGTPCRLVAGYGTDHVGYGRCKYHTGSTQTGRIAAAIEAGNELAGEMEIEPHDALLRMVYRARRRQQYWEGKIAQLEPDDMVVQFVRRRLVHTAAQAADDNAERRQAGRVGDTVEEMSSRAELHIAIRSEREAADDVVKWAKTALDAGVDERRVRIAETLAEQIGEAIGGIYAKVAPFLTDEGKQVFQSETGRQLRALEGGQA